MPAISRHHVWPVASVTSYYVADQAKSTARNDFTSEPTSDEADQQNDKKTFP
jgi:hypothetical protein